MLALVNSGGQTEINSIIYDDPEEEKEDNWQDIITDLQPVNIPTKADRILPREYLIFGTLLNKIVSLQSGFATFMADRNMYSKSGNNILIPTGSIGLLAYSGGGDERLVMEVIRITTPNNLTIVFQTKTNLSDVKIFGKTNIAGSTITIRPTKDIFFQKPVDGKIYLKIDDTY